MLFSIADHALSEIVNAVLRVRRFILAILVIILLDLVLAFAFGSYIRVYFSYLLGNNEKEIFSSLLFFEGLIIVGVGAWIASGYSEMKIAESRNPASQSYLAEKIFTQRKDYRKEQMFSGIVLMIIGGILLLISYLISQLLL